MIIVDDEIRLRAGLCDFYPWEELGFLIAGQMAGGAEALEFVRSNPVDVVLTDISMPEMSGIELAERLSREFPGIRLVFLSGYADFSYAQQALRLGVSDYILKPVKAADLTAVFTGLREKLDRERGGAPARSDSYYGKIIHAVQRYVLDNLQNASLEQAAALVNLSPGYLSTLYKQETGKSFSEFLLDTRMRTAKELLLDIRYKTYEVSGLLGYENPKNFTRAFKLYHGLSPREYRRSGADSGKGRADP